MGEISAFKPEKQLLTPQLVELLLLQLELEVPLQMLKEDLLA
jgi:hypothetical protein